MSVISQAAKRLEQLRLAGIELPRKLPSNRRNDLGVESSERHQLNDTSPATHGDGATAVAAASAPKACGRYADIPGAKLLESGLMVPDQPPNLMTNEFRAIKRPLIANASAQESGSRRNVILVTSAVPGEGKSFCAINLALSIAAELDRTALLIDADVLRPSCAERLGVLNDTGLLDLLEQPLQDPMSSVYATSIPRFMFLSAGRPRGSSAELLTSSRMTEVIDELSRGNDDRMIIIDGPPLLPTTEARSLAQLVGQVVVVVESGQTSTGFIDEAFKILQPCKIVLSVLNKQSSRLGYSADGYGYGY